MTGFTRALRGVAGGSFPLWSTEMPRAASVIRARTSSAGAQAIYFPSCISRTMGPEAGDDTSPLVDTLVLLARRAGVAVHVPPDAAGTCCGVPFSSKGYVEAHALAANRAIANFWRWSDAGRLPVFVDTSPCTYGLLHAREALSDENKKRFDALTILDGVAFVHDVLLPKLTVTRMEPTAILHPVCSLVKMGLVPKLEAVARACAETAVIPEDAGCCGFAGDRGFLFPELTASATRLEAEQAKSAGAAGHWSSSRTCEAGLSRATGERYRSFVHLVERATRPYSPRCASPSSRWTSPGKTGSPTTPARRSFSSVQPTTARRWRCCRRCSRPGSRWTARRSPSRPAGRASSGCAGWRAASGCT